MKITLESTSKLVTINGVPARVWEGTTDSGIAVHAFITRIGVHHSLDTAQFERELEACRPPSVDVARYPAHILLEDLHTPTPGHGNGGVHHGHDAFDDSRD